MFLTSVPHRTVQIRNTRASLKKSNKTKLLGLKNLLIPLFMTKDKALAIIPNPTQGPQGPAMEENAVGQVIVEGEAAMWNQPDDTMSNAASESDLHDISAKIKRM